MAHDLILRGDFASFTDAPYAGAMDLQQVRERLRVLSDDMTDLIHRYGMRAQGPLDVLKNARACITDTSDYVRFLELSLEGRILADEGERLLAMGQKQKSDEPPLH